MKKVRSFPINFLRAASNAQIGSTFEGSGRRLQSNLPQLAVEPGDEQIENTIISRGSGLFQAVLHCHCVCMGVRVLPCVV